MLDIFKKYLLDRANFSEEELSLIQSLSIEKKIAKRASILREGEVAEYLIFIQKGLLRIFRSDHNGNTYTLKFAGENRWLSDRESYLTGKPSNFNINATEDSEVLIWKKDDFRFLLNAVPALKQLMKKLTEQSQIAQQNRIYQSISSSAEEKYLQFIAQCPCTFDRVPLHMLASYLGVTRETLSRIRKQSVSK
jgi:CRP-like cAMP-binding protein